MSTAKALTSFVGPGRRVVVQGQEIDLSDPIITGRESLFALPDDYKPVEAATAEPGTKRSTTRTKTDDK